MKRANLVIGTRGSKLAMIYAENVKKELKKYYFKEIELKKIVTTGDQKQDERLSEIGGKGLFSKQIEKDLLNKNICLLYTSPSPRDRQKSRMPSSA